jgi:hypothetical protein
MLDMAPQSCVYCGDACESTIPLDWTVAAGAADGTVQVRLNLCERCSRSWTCFADDFCPAATPESTSVSRKKKRQQ